MVGVSGFEPPASCSRSRRANRAALHPDTPLVDCQADIVGWISLPARWLRQTQPPGAELSNAELVEVSKRWTTQLF